MNKDKQGEEKKIGDTKCPYQIIIRNTKTHMAAEKLSLSNASPQREL